MKSKLTHYSAIKSLLKVSVVGLMATTLAACGIFSSDDSGPKPTPLHDFKQKVEVSDVWSHSVGNGQGGIWLNLHPVIEGNTIYAASHSGEVYAFNRMTGNELWNTELDYKITGGVGAGNGLIAVGTSSGKIVALNATDGKTKWIADASGQMLSAPAIANNTVVAQTINGKVTAFNATNGQKIWQQTAVMPVLLLRGSSTPVIKNGLVFTGFSNGDMNAWELDNGKEIWQNTIALPEGSSELGRMVDVNATPLIVGSRLYAVSYQGNLKAINAPTGQTLWSRKSSSYQGLTEDNNTLFVSSTNDDISSIDATSGGSSWTQKDLAYRQLSAPAADGNYIVAGDYEGYVHVLAQNDGSIVGRGKIASSGIRVQPLVVDNMIYVYTNSGELYALKLKPVK